MRRHLPPIAALIAAAMITPHLAHAQAERWWQHVKVLADDSLKGRDTGSPGYYSAARYVASQFKAAGLQPAGVDGDWYQPVDFVDVRVRGEGVQVALREKSTWSPLVPGHDLRLTARPATGDVEAPLVFVGWGLSLPQAGVDDLAGVDLRGKIAVHLNGVPNGLSGPMQAHGSRSRWQGMRAKGAVGVLAVGAPGVWDESANRFGNTFSLADATLDDNADQRIAGTINPALMPRLLAGSGLSWDSLTAMARRGERLPGAALTVSLKGMLPTERRTVRSPNVVGMLPGTDPVLRNEVIVISAHLDHVGTMRGPALTGDSIFNGAMDNASGAATLIETARAVVAAGGNRRTIVFAAVTAEEKGLLGSRYYGAHPSMTRGTIVANLNTDMFLPLIPLKGVFAYGFDESDLADDLVAVTTSRGLEVYPDPEPHENRFVRSDQYSFIRQGIPALAFKVGYRPGTPDEQVWLAWVRDHYHKVSDDTAQPIDFGAAAAFNALYAELALRVANRATRPAWRKASFFATPAR
ncbi:MAG: M28 family peptidase [Gemmatimonadaceae bacterium]|nr:M28 family peptidase [Gemmatimonadaceae bacterium]